MWLQSCRVPSSINLIGFWRIVFATVWLLYAHCLGSHMFNNLLHVRFPPCILPSVAANSYRMSGEIRKHLEQICFLKNKRLFGICRFVLAFLFTIGLDRLINIESWLLKYSRLIDGMFGNISGNLVRG